MNDFTTLRAAVASTGSVLRDIQRFPTVDVNRTDLAELLAAYDALRAAGTTKRGKAEYPPAFLAAYDAMKEHGARWREGTTPAAAHKAWAARVKAGADPEQVLAGTVRYALYIKATGSEVKMAQTFFGPGEHYSAEWTLPTARTQNRIFPGRPPLTDVNQANNAEALRLLGQPMFADDGMTIEAAP